MAELSQGPPPRSGWIELIAVWRVPTPGTCIAMSGKPGVAGRAVCVVRVTGRVCHSRFRVSSSGYQVALSPYGLARGADGGWHKWIETFGTCCLSWVAGNRGMGP